jgi:hypothetical protein
LNKFSHNQALLVTRIALLVGGSVAAAGATETHTQLSVSATVRAVARIEMRSVPQRLTISANDLARGYIDVEQATTAAVRSNSQTGYTLEFLTLAPLFSGITVRGLDTDLALTGEGGMVVRRWQQARMEELSLNYRFALAPGLSAGEYPWPVQLAVRPLEAN